MYIHEAIAATTEKYPYIQRNTEEWIDGGLKIRPTNTCECCIVSSKVNGRPSKCWSPFKADLTADDWEVVGRY